MSPIQTDNVDMLRQTHRAYPKLRDPGVTSTRNTTMTRKRRSTTEETDKLALLRDTQDTGKMFKNGPSPFATRLSGGTVSKRPSITQPHCVYIMSNDHMQRDLITTVRL